MYDPIKKGCMMEHANSENWFWTPELLRELIQTMKEVAHCENGNWYFGPEGLNEMIRDRFIANGHASLNRNIAMMMQLLVFYGVLEPGKPGVKPAGYRRAFYPEKADEIGWAHIDAFRQYAREQAQRPWVSAP